MNRAEAIDRLTMCLDCTDCFTCAEHDYAIEALREQETVTNRNGLTNADRLAYYEDMEEQGRLVVLPCEVGDRVYSKDGKYAEIEGFYVDKRSITAQVSFVCDYDCKYCAFNSWHTEYSGENSCDGEWGTAVVSVDEIGKTVFLTREDAERALKEGADRG